MPKLFFARSAGYGVQRIRYKPLDGSLPQFTGQIFRPENILWQENKTGVSKVSPLTKTLSPVPDTPN